MTPFSYARRFPLMKRGQFCTASTERRIGLRHKCATRDLQQVLSGGHIGGAHTQFARGFAFESRSMDDHTNRAGKDALGHSHREANGLY